MYELQFPLLLDTMIANTEFESDGSGTNSPSPEKKRKGGLGKGGAAAKYCTMSVAAVLGVVAHSKKLKFCIDVNFLSITFPPQPGDTRWGSWQDASDWFVSMWKPWCSFVHAECVWGLGPRSWSLGSCVAEKPHAMQQVVLFGSSLFFAAFFRIFPHFFRTFPHFFIFRFTAFFPPPLLYGTPPP